MSRRVLELGNYVVPAYAGMILAEQGHTVEKWTNGKDPILGLHRGTELWDWINHGKTLRDHHPSRLQSEWEGWDIVLDNLRPATLAAWGIDPAAIAKRTGCIWVSMRSEVGDRSFDIMAQARSVMEFCPWIPFWIGDTSGGLWLAFKALAVSEPGHYVLGQSSCLQKLVEGELIIDEPRTAQRIPWEVDTYRPAEGAVEVEFKGEQIREPIRDRAWKLANLWHVNGRMRI